MSRKCKCGNTIPAGRLALNIDTCLECGNEEAMKEIAAKMKRVAVGYNKGPILYMGASEVAKKNLQGTMGAQGRSVATLADMVIGTYRYEGTKTGRFPTNVKVLKIRKQVIGVAVVNGEKRALFDKNDPITAKASRVVWFDKSNCQFKSTP